jgi:aminoglycoside phosphotransferase family enzyme/predicted kinase
MDEDRQQAVLDFLSDGDAYEHPGATVERITTHAAVIFLIERRAYKMKRAVRYSFLDFRDLEQRHEALEAELRLNRRTAPDLYHRLVPVTRSESGLVLDGQGEPVEWLLEMARFEQSRILDQVAARGELDRATLDRLADEIATFHEIAEERPQDGGYAGMRTVIDGNGQDLGSLVGPVFPQAAVDALNERTRAELDRRRDLLEQRRRAGRVRHCHGDLHLGNIVLLDRGPVLFDCLEFDEALASIDVFYDLAFLLMDLWHRRLAGPAQRLLNRYLDATWDDGGGALLPLFLSCRAAIRAKVQGFGAKLAEDSEERTRDVAQARAYLELARAFLAPAAPRLIAIGGLSGTGKSTLAFELAPHLGAAPGAVVLRSDVVRKKLFGVAPDQRLGPEAYARSVSVEVYDTLAQRAGTLVRGGQTVIVDAVFLDPAERMQIERVAKDAGVPFQGIWLEASAELLRARVDRRHGDASDATSAVVRSQLRADPGRMTWPRLAADRPLAEVATAADRVLCGTS